MTDPSGLDMPTGTVEEAIEWVGRSSETQFADEPVSGSRIRFFASMTHDANPSYWDEGFADEQWGGLTFPPSLLTTWMLPPMWRPGGVERGPMFATQVPLPAEMSVGINAATEMALDRQILEGEWLNWLETITDVSAEKRTRLGRGHFITSDTVFRDQTGERVATITNSLFRYDPSDVAEDSADADGTKTEAAPNPVTPAERERDRYESLGVDEISEGDSVTAFEFPVTMRTVIHNVAASRDFYPGHHDPEFARSQGNESIYLNTVAFQGLIDRLVLRWAGPAWRIADRSIRMQGSAEAGYTLTVDGDVTAVLRSEGRVEIDAGVYKTGRRICPATITIERSTE